MLAPVLDPFDRPLQDERRRGQRYLFRIQQEFGAEAAAHVGRHHAQLILVEPQQLHERGACLVRKLGRGPQREPVLIAVVGGKRAASLERMRAAAMLLEVDARAMTRASKCCLCVAVGLLELDQQVACFCRMRARGARSQGGAAIGHGRQRLIIDVNKSSGVLGAVARLRNYDRNRLADECDLVAGEHKRGDIGRKLGGAEAEREPLLREQRFEIGERKQRADVRVCFGCARIDAPDAGVRVRAAHEGRLQHAGKVEVVDETSAADQQSAIFEPLDRLADICGLFHAASPIRCSAVAVARMSAPQQDTHEVSRVGARHPGSPHIAISVSATRLWLMRATGLLRQDGMASPFLLFAFSRRADTAFARSSPSVRIF